MSQGSCLVGKSRSKIVCDGIALTIFFLVPDNLSTLEISGSRPWGILEMSSDRISVKTRSLDFARWLEFMKLCSASNCFYGLTIMGTI
jgi:hypothetical protein